MIFQKQIVCSNTTLAQRNNTIDYFGGALPLQKQGRRVINFDISNQQINYFKLAGIRFKNNRSFGVVPPFGGFRNIDTYLGIDKVIVISKIVAENFYITSEGVALDLPLDYYTIKVILNDYDDTDIAAVLAWYHNEYWGAGAIQQAVTPIKPHHIPDADFYYDPAVDTYQEFYIKALVEMENLPQIKARADR